jgi:hypothetical protein
MTPLGSASVIGGFVLYWPQAGEALSTQLHGTLEGVLVRVGGAMPLPHKTDKIRNV